MKVPFELLLAWKSQAKRKTLELHGARQVGKTYIVKKFAEEQYDKVIYINLFALSGELLMDAYQDLRQSMRAGNRYDNPIEELMRRYDPGFTDQSTTVVIIDEIQESAVIYNRIREFTRELNADFIITGSYLGHILDKDFTYSAGDLASIEVNTLNFEEFVQALDKKHIFDQLDLYGNGDEEVYRELEELFEIYCQIGGYPSVVLKYLETKSYQACRTELSQIINLFSNESKRYFEDIADNAVYDNIFCSIARILGREKKGFKQGSFSEELQKIVVKDYDSNISKAVINRAIDWLYSSAVIGFAGKVIDLDVSNFKAKSRCFFT